MAFARLHGVPPCIAALALRRPAENDSSQHTGLRQSCYIHYLTAVHRRIHPATATPPAMKVDGKQKRIAIGVVTLACLLFLDLTVATFAHAQTAPPRFRVASLTLPTLPMCPPPLPCTHCTALRNRATRYSVVVASHNAALKVASPGGACGPGVARCPSRQWCSQSGTCGKPTSIHCGTGCRGAPYNSPDATCPAATRLTKQTVPTGITTGWTVDKVERVKNKTSAWRPGFSLDDIHVPKPALNNKTLESEKLVELAPGGGPDLPNP